jgi:hypothetical protein
MVLHRPALASVGGFPEEEFVAAASRRKNLRLLWLAANRQSYSRLLLRSLWMGSHWQAHATSIGANEQANIHASGGGPATPVVPARFFAPANNASTAMAGNSSKNPTAHGVSRFLPLACGRRLRPENGMSQGTRP